MAALISDYFRPLALEKKREDIRLPCVDPSCRKTFATPAARANHVKYKHPLLKIGEAKALVIKAKRHRQTYGRKAEALKLLETGTLLVFAILF